MSVPGSGRKLQSPAAPSTRETRGPKGFPGRTTSGAPVTLPFPRGLPTSLPPSGNGPNRLLGEPKTSLTLHTRLYHPWKCLWLLGRFKFYFMTPHRRKEVFPSLISRDTLTEPLPRGWPGLATQRRGLHGWESFLPDAFPDLHSPWASWWTPIPLF